MIHYLKRNWAKHIILLLVPASSTLLIILLASMDLGFVRHPSHVSDDVLHIALTVIALLVIFPLYRWLQNTIADYTNTKLNPKSQHGWVDNPGYYQATQEKFFTPSKPFQHTVLLLHGFDSSSQDFLELENSLQQAKLHYFAPNFLGFGLDQTRLLENIKLTDWQYQTLMAYDRLAQLAERVSVVGFSMGGTMATYLAEHRPVHHLILASPGLHASAGEKTYQFILSHWWTRWIPYTMLPMVPKQLLKHRSTILDIMDVSETRKTMQFLFTPVAAFKALVDSLSCWRLNKTRSQDITLIYGEKDQTISIQPTINLLKTLDTPTHIVKLPNSGHDIFRDFDKTQAIDTILQTLTGDIP